jgi:hypothetical protein
MKLQCAVLICNEFLKLTDYFFVLTSREFGPSPFKKCRKMFTSPNFIFLRGIMFPDETDEKLGDLISIGGRLSSKSAESNQEI